MPTFLGTTAGGRAISGGVLAPRSNRGSTGAVATFFLGSLPSPVSVEYILVAGGGGSPSYGCGATPGAWPCRACVSAPQALKYLNATYSRLYA